MRRVQLWGLALVVGLLIHWSVAWTADAPPVMGSVLGRLHQANHQEIARANVALQRARLEATRSFARTLIDDHTAADEKVVVLARNGRVELPQPAPAPKALETAAADIPYGATFDVSFARLMLEDHVRAITTATTTRDATNDQDLRKLLDELMPILRLHRDMAQKILDAQTPRAVL